MPISFAEHVWKQGPGGTESHDVVSHIREFKRTDDAYSNDNATKQECHWLKEKKHNRAASVTLKHNVE